MQISTVSSTEIKNNFGRFLDLVISGKEIVITKNGKEVGRFIPKDAVVTYLTDSLVGVLKGNYDLKASNKERVNKKYGAIN